MHSKELVKYGENISKDHHFGPRDFSPTEEVPTSAKNVSSSLSTHGGDQLCFLQFKNQTLKTYDRQMEVETPGMRTDTKWGVSVNG